MKRLLLAALLFGCPGGGVLDDDDASTDDDDVVADDDDDSGDDDTGDDDDSTPGSWRSALYPSDWTPTFTGDEDRFLHDVSYAGYHRSEAGLPQVIDLLGAFDVTMYGADPTGAVDSTPGIQAAIDAAEAAGGGDLHLPEGSYRADGLLLVDAPGVLLVGDGPDRSRLWFTSDVGMSDTSHLTFRGAAATGAELPLVVNGVPRSHEVAVDDASGVAPGDQVQVGWVITDDFVADHGMESFWAVSNGQWRAFFRREVVAVDTVSEPDVITLDVPLRYPALLRDGASVRAVSGHLTECGVHSLGLSTVGDWDAAWTTDRNHALRFDRVMDCTVRDVASFESLNSSDDRGRHLLSGGIKIIDSKRVTIADTVLERAQNRGGGGNGYLFEVSRSNEVLIRDCVGRGGRHNFIQNWDFGTSGIVWLRTTSVDGRSLPWQTDDGPWVGFSEFHHSLAMANLIDASFTNDGWGAVNRRTFSSGAGHSATQSVFWNTTGDGEIKSFQYGHGYIIGTGPDVAVRVGLDEGGLFAEASGTAPEDWTEGLGAAATLDPPSLFEDQLARRLGR